MSIKLCALSHRFSLKEGLSRPAWCSPNGRNQDRDTRERMTDIASNARDLAPAEVDHLPSYMVTAVNDRFRKNLSFEVTVSGGPARASRTAVIAW